MTTLTMPRSIELLNADYQRLGYISFNKASRLIYLGKAVVEEADESKEWSRWLYPKVVRLVKQAKLAFDKIYGKALISKRGVLVRDERKCAYCKAHADTIDHIIPRSRGGLNTWENLVACCFKCNNKKDNRTPKEAGMTLLIQPHVPTRAELRAKN